MRAKIVLDGSVNTYGREGGQVIEFLLVLIVALQWAILRQLQLGIVQHHEHEVEILVTGGESGKTLPQVEVGGILIDLEVERQRRRGSA